MNMAERIKELRLQAGLTQEELGAKLGLQKSAIAKYENGRVKNIKRSTIRDMAEIFKCRPSHIMGFDEPDLSGIKNLSFPAAYPVPILGTICAGDGVLCEQNYEGEFFVDKRIKADYCLRVKGDSMIDAEIYDGDYAFIRKSYDYEDGHIYAVVYGTEQNASLKKLFRSEDNWILSPCNSAYAPILVTPDDMLIVGECVGVYHGVK